MECELLFAYIWCFHEQPCENPIEKEKHSQVRSMFIWLFWMVIYPSLFETILRTKERVFILSQLYTSGTLQMSFILTLNRGTNWFLWHYKKKLFDYQGKKNTEKTSNAFFFQSVKQVTMYQKKKVYANGYHCLRFYYEKMYVKHYCLID